MSWSFSVTEKTADELEEALEGASANARQQAPESDEQVTAAIAAAVTLAQSGAFGNTTEKFNVGLSGHGNPKHEPASGMSNVSIYVSVSQSS